jgi:hypothetical protein
MSIATQITRLQTAKSNIKTAIENKGVTVPSTATLDGYPTYIAQIEGGGGGGDTSKYGNLIDNYSGSTVTNFNFYALFEHLTIPSNIQTLWLNFPNYSQIKSISFEANSQCTSLPSQWFLNVTTLTNATLPPLITIIPNQCFDNTRISTIDIPSGVTTINSYAFRFNPSLTTVNFQSNNTLTTIGNNVFDSCTNLSSITIPSSVTSIGDNAFNSCSSLTSIVIPSGVISIGSATFRNCSSLTSIDIPDSVTSLGQQIFLNCSSLTSCTIGNGVTNISNFAFQGCSSLTSINIPSGVTNIGNAFNGCTGLTSVTVKAATPPTLDGIAFNNTNNCPIYVPSESVETYKAASGWSNYASRIQAIPS